MRENDVKMDFTFSLAVILSILSPNDLNTGEFDNESKGFLKGGFHSKSQLEPLSITLFKSKFKLPLELPTLLATLLASLLVLWM